MRDGRIAAVAAYDDPARRRAERRPGRRRGAAARAGRHPRPRQRARSHRVGGLRLRDAGGGGRRRHDDRGHAAQLASRPPSPSPRCARSRTWPRDQVAGRRRLLGRRRAGQPRRPRGAARGGRLRVQVLPARLRRRGVPAAATATASSRRWTETARLGALLIVHAEDARPDRRDAPAGTAYDGFLGSRPDGSEGAAIDQRDRDRAATGGRRPRAAPVQRRRPCPRCTPPAPRAST